ncbi:MAG: YgjV family protein [Clostridia bacterium]|nr:YgjV family protein [Clostridia bacterium]
MIYITAQIFGFMATACCLIGPLFKYKWQILVNSAVANLLVALNFFLLGEVGTGVIMNFVAILQIVVSLIHLYKQTSVTHTEKVVFLIMYAACGALGFKKLVDILPVIGAILLSISVFIRDEQRTRIYMLSNAAVWIIYDIIIGSSTVFAQFATVIMTCTAMYKYRSKRND